MKKGKEKKQIRVKGLEKIKSFVKSLNKNQIIVIIVAVVALSAAIALSIALPLTIGKTPKVAEPVFEEFDPQVDNDVSVVWNKIKGASTYTIEYCYGARTEENIRSVTTQGTKFFTERKTAVLSVRVRAEVGKDALFSDWISMDVPPYKLVTPTVAISNVGVVGWNSIVFPYRGDNPEVSQYSFAVKVDDGEFFAYAPLSNNSVNIRSYLVSYINSFYDENYVEWEDVVVTVRVAALNTISTADLRPKGYTDEYLKSACESSDYAYAELIITKEIYEGMIG